MPMLYHYTNATALISIVKRRELWATGANYLNDPTEITFGARALAKRLDETEATSGAAEDLLIRAVDLLKSQYMDAHSPELVVEERAFITSFSRSDESLTLWRLYAGRNGFSIGFDEETLLSWLGENVEMPEDEDERVALNDNLRLSGNVEEVAYGETCIDLLANEIAALADAPQRMDVRESELRAVFQKLSSIKHIAFEDEREARLVVRAIGDFATDPRVRVSADGSLVAYRSIRFPRDAVRSITIAPGANPSQQRRALESLIADGGRGAYSNVQLKESTLPFSW